MIAFAFLSIDTSLLVCERSSVFVDLDLRTISTAVD